jgi:hypothetical protein
MKQHCLVALLCCIHTCTATKRVRCTYIPVTPDKEFDQCNLAHSRQTDRCMYVILTACLDRSVVPQRPHIVSIHRQVDLKDPRHHVFPLFKSMNAAPFPDQGSMNRVSSNAKREPYTGKSRTDLTMPHLCPTLHVLPPLQTPAKQTMATTHILINDFVGLPIIISDFDALPSNNDTSSPFSSQPAQQLPTPTSGQLSTAPSISQAYSNNTVSAMQQNWTTGFSDFADEMWAKMTQGMKQKLREACVRAAEEDG